MSAINVKYVCVPSVFALRSTAHLNLSSPARIAVKGPYNLNDPHRKHGSVLDFALEAETMKIGTVGEALGNPLGNMRRYALAKGATARLHARDRTTGALRLLTLWIQISSSSSRRTFHRISILAPILLVELI